MMGVYAFKNPLAVVRTPFNHRRMVLAEDMHGQAVITDEVLGEALGFADPAGAVEHLYYRHEQALKPHSLYGEVTPPHPSGRTWSWAFDLEGAMLLCRVARTANAAEVFASLKGFELREELAHFDEEAGGHAGTCNVVTLRPKRKMTRRRQR